MMRKEECKTVLGRNERKEEEWRKKGIEKENNKEE